MASLQNTFVQMTIQDAEAVALQTLLENLGILLIGLESPLPLWPFIAAAFAINELLSLFGSGRPKFQDTDALITAYQQSAYYPLHALASDLSIAAKNGAPISDSNPAIQAQFSAWKQGTIQSIQSLAGQTPGPTGAGYWQLQQLIDLSWDWSAGGQQQVIKAVKAIDQLTIGLSQLAQQTTTGSGGGGGGSGGGGTAGGGSGTTPCVSGDPDSDEILDLCNALQSALGNLQSGGGQQSGNGDCCAAIVNAISAITGALNVIAASVGAGSNAGPPVDLSGIVAALGQLVAAVSAIAPAPAVDLTPLVNAVNGVAAALENPDDDVAAQVKRLADQNDAATALAKALVQQWSAQIPGDPGSVQLILA